MLEDHVQGEERGLKGEVAEEPNHQEREGAPPTPDQDGKHEEAKDPD